GFALGGCRTWSAESENGPQRGQFLQDSQAHSPAMGQEDCEKWTVAAHLQPAMSKSDSLPGTCSKANALSWRSPSDWMAREARAATECAVVPPRSPCQYAGQVPVPFSQTMRLPTPTCASPFV